MKGARTSGISVTARAWGASSVRSTSTAPPEATPPPPPSSRAGRRGPARSTSTWARRERRKLKLFLRHALEGGRHQGANVERRLGALHLLAARGGGGMPRHEELAAVLVRQRAHVEGADAARLRRDLFLVHSHQRPQHRRARRFADDHHVVAGLGRPLAEALPGDERA